MTATYIVEMTLTVEMCVLAKSQEDAQFKAQNFIDSLGWGSEDNVETSYIYAHEYLDDWERMADD